MKNKVVDLYTPVKIVVQNKKVFVISVLTSLSLAIVYLFIATPKYESYISINPIEENSRSQFSGLDGIASTFGFNLRGNDQSSFYIPDIVRSRVLKESIVKNLWHTNRFNDKVNLITYLGLDQDSGFSISKLIFGDISVNKKLSHIESAINIIEKRISVSEEESGLIVINVLMEEPELAAEVVNYIAKYIKDYIGRVYSVHSLDHRRFIEERLNNSKDQLSLSEEELTKFREKHPFAMDTPDLQLQRGRLIRNVEVNQQVYITLRQQYEMARIDELKEVPVINILDKGEIPAHKSSPKTSLVVLSSLIFALCASCFYLFSMIIYNEYKNSELS